MLTNIKNNYWFTLAEILVAITIIWIISLSVAKINFWSSIDIQKAKIFNNNIYNILNEVKNYSLLWKWVTQNQIVADSWKINISKTNSWEIKTQFLSWTTWQNYNELNLETNLQESISNITCSDLNWNNENELSNIDIYFTGSQLWLSWCSNETNRILNIKTKFKDIENWIKINQVSWTIETY